MTIERITTWFELCAMILVAVGFGLAQGIWLGWRVPLGIGAMMVATSVCLFALSWSLTRRSTKVGDRR